MLITTLSSTLLLVPHPVSHPLHWLPAVTSLSSAVCSSLSMRSTHAVLPARASCLTASSVFPLTLSSMHVAVDSPIAQCYAQQLSVLYL